MLESSEPDAIGLQLRDKRANVHLPRHDARLDGQRRRSSRRLAHRHARRHHSDRCRADGRRGDAPPRHQQPVHLLGHEAPVWYTVIVAIYREIERRTRSRPSVQINRVCAEAHAVGRDAARDDVILALIWRALAARRLESNLFVP